jgi:uncharacterized membrane protein
MLKRNCSLSPRQLLAAYAAICCASFAVAILCAWHGAWYVLAFAVLEMAAVALAFVHYGRHATDHEHIVLDQDGLLVERVEAGLRHAVRLDPYGTRIVAPRQYDDLISLRGHGMAVEVGRYATQAIRRQVARELASALQAGVTVPAPTPF